MSVTGKITAALAAAAIGGGGAYVGSEFFHRKQEMPCETARAVYNAGLSQWFNPTYPDPSKAGPGARKVIEQARQNAVTACGTEDVEDKPVELPVPLLKQTPQSTRLRARGAVFLKSPTRSR
jgi:hypothetical protein